MIIEIYDQNRKFMYLTIIETLVVLGSVIW